MFDKPTKAQYLPMYDVLKKGDYIDGLHPNKSERCSRSDFRQYYELQ